MTRNFIHLRQGWQVAAGPWPSFETTIPCCAPPQLIPLDGPCRPTQCACHCKVQPDWTGYLPGSLGSTFGNFFIVLPLNHMPSTRPCSSGCAPLVSPSALSSLFLAIQA